MSQEIILQKEQQLARAMLASDVKVLDDLISEKLVFTLPTGMIAGKQMDLEAHRSGFQKLSTLNVLERQVQFYGAFAVVQAKVQLEGRFGENSIQGVFCYTRVWANLEQRWQIIAGHCSVAQNI